MSQQLEEAITTSLDSIYHSIHSIERAWDGETTESQQKRKRPILNYAQREALLSWCSEARLFAEEEIAGGLGIPFQGRETGPKRKYVFPREAFNAIEGWFRQLEGQSGPTRKIADPSGLVSLSLAA